MIQYIYKVANNTLIHLGVREQALRYGTWQVGTSDEETRVAANWRQSEKRVERKGSRKVGSLDDWELAIIPGDHRCDASAAHEPASDDISVHTRAISKYRH